MRYNEFSNLSSENRRTRIDGCGLQTNCLHTHPGNFIAANNRAITNQLPENCSRIDMLPMGAFQIS
jgi:hypothetical protein